MMRPDLPRVGDEVSVFGVSGRVTEIVAMSDWAWRVVISSLSVMGNVEKWSVEVPTDYRVTDDACVTDV